MRDRLLQAGVSLFGAGGVALLLYAQVLMPESIRLFEEMGRVSQNVHARLLSTSVRRVNAGRRSNKPTYNYTPVGAFEIVGQEGRVYNDVDLDNGTLRAYEAEATQAAAQYRAGMVVDAWFDPRSRDDPMFFPLSVLNPAVAAEKMRGERDLLRWIGGGLVGVAAVFAVLLLRRPVTRRTQAQL
jgi:Protein of unknown function (DUF3592)